MLRSGLNSASLCAAASLLAGGCAGATPPTLPTLPEIVEALSLSEAEVVGSPTEVYARVARGAMACWFGSAGPLKTSYIYHGEAQPPAKGGKAKIVIHERDPSAENPKGLRVFQIAIEPEGDTAKLKIENLKLKEPLAKAMEGDVRRWAGGAIGCSQADGDWSAEKPGSKPSAQPPQPKKKGRAT